MDGAHIPPEAAIDLDAMQAELGMQDTAAATAEANDPAKLEALKLTKDMLLPAVMMIAHTAAPNWALTEMECDALAESYAAVIIKYFPDGPKSFGPELNALIITGAIVAPRLVAGKSPRLPAREKGQALEVESAEYDAGYAVDPNAAVPVGE